MCVYLSNNLTHRIYFKKIHDVKIKGTVSYQNLGPGFWGVIGKGGEKWRPVNMPEQLKQEGAEVELKINTLKDQNSLFMWGTAVKITGFQTLTP